MRKNWRPRVRPDRRGKITTGTKGLSSKGKKIPKSLDYFNLQKFPELIEVYGDKPNKLIIVFGLEDETLFFQTEYVLWARSEKGAWKKRSCDGEECTHHVPEVIDGKKFNRGDVHECFGCGSSDCSIPSDDQCKCYTGFSAYVVDPGKGRIVSLTPYRFQTNSVNSGDNLLSELYLVKSQYGKIPRGLPFELTVDMMEVQTDKGKNKFPLWNLKAYGTMEQINSFVQRTQLPTNENNSIIADPSKLLQSKASAEDSNEGDEHPYPENEGEKEAAEFFEGITGEKPDVVEQVNSDDILQRRGLLSDIVLDQSDVKGVLAQSIKIIMELCNQNKTSARKKLKEYSKVEDAHPSGYDSSADILEKGGNSLVQLVFERVKKDYRDHLTKIEADENQGDLLNGKK